MRLRFLSNVHDPEAEVTRFGFAWELVALGCLSVAMAWTFRLTPPQPLFDPQEEAVRKRLEQWSVRDADLWQDLHGDRKIPWERAHGHLALVIDDVGRELRNFGKLHSLRAPITFSVLPDAIYTPGVLARLVEDRRRPREILLHLPEEPLAAEQMADAAESREHFLLATDDTATLQEKTRRAIARVPLAVGVNNHMGSRLSTDASSQAAIFDVLVQHGLFFLDSRTTADSVASACAQQAGLAVLERSIFVDHDPSLPAIRAQLARATELSLVAPIVLIAHPGDGLSEVLPDILDDWHQQGIGVYFASELLSHGVSAHPSEEAKLLVQGLCRKGAPKRGRPGADAAEGGPP